MCHAKDSFEVHSTLVTPSIVRFYGQPLLSARSTGSAVRVQVSQLNWCSRSPIRQCPRMVTTNPPDGTYLFCPRLHSQTAQVTSVLGSSWDLRG